MITAIYVSSICLVCSYAYIDNARLSLILSILAGILYCIAEMQYKKLIKRIEKLERKESEDNARVFVQGQKNR